MTVIKPIDTTIIKIFKCGICKKLYVYNCSNIGIKCPSKHFSGTCCHFNDKEINKARMEEIIEIAGI